MFHKDKITVKIILQTVMIILLIGLIDYIIFKSGGIKSSFGHLMYLPIILSTFIFNFWGNLTISILAGLSVGPFMPEVVELNMMQPTSNWIVRMCFYICINWIVYFLLYYLNKKNAVIQKNATINSDTGLPNMNQLEMDINQWINEKSFNSFTIIVFIFENMDQINRYISKSIGIKALKYLLKIASERFPGSPLYSFYLNEFAVVFPNDSIETVYQQGNEFIQKFNNNITIDDLPIDFILHGGIINFPMHGRESSVIIQKLGRALDQAKHTQQSIVIYNDRFAKQNLKKCNILVSFNKALKEDTLKLFYQPKIDIKRNEVICVEALLRWDDFDHNISIPELITTIEEAGFINELTKKVTKEAIIQLKKWQDKGLNFNVAVNLSSKDLQDASIVEFVIDCLNEYQMDPSHFEYEITERSFIKNSDDAVNILNKLKDIGIKISIDDYGTGYNSLMNITKLPIDYIKIDKYFIDQIIEEKGKIIVKNIITLIHYLNKKVCAEGVETEEQLQILKKMGCDYIQGYYFSKPLSPDDLECFVNDKLLKG